MKRRNTTRNALLTSIISLLLCVSMLVGTTFAWFTDSVVSGTNQIIAGNLDVEVYYGDPADKNSIEKVEKLFDDVNGEPILWEPGAVAYEKLTVANLGTLALKYQMSVNFDNENEIEGTGAKLSQVLKIAVVDIEDLVDRESALAAAKEAVKADPDAAKLHNFALPGDLLKGESDQYGIVIWWEPSDEDNNWNVQNGKKTTDGQPLHIDLGINLFATQLTHEEDSFDKYYDKDTAVFTVAEANAMLAENKDVALVNCIERDGVIQIPANYTGTLTLVDSTIKSVQAAGNAKIVIIGAVVVNAKGSGVATVAETETTFDGSAITANGTLNISGNGNLTAIAADVKAAFGIGGMNVSELNISDVHIVKVTGAGVNSKIGTNYGKQDFEGAPAIGSGYSGAVITLDNVTIDEALGGSKGAGIGARYHTGVTIKITDSIINNVVGGSSSAGIGGSRMTKHMSGDLQNVTINITNSIVNATGGDFGAGIGSGYNTYTTAVSPAPVISVTIDAASKITAQGGWLGAGIGTGHNAIGFVGSIACDTSNVKAGSSADPSWCCWGAPCTLAQDVGLGVLNTKHYSDLFTGVSDSKTLAEAIAAGETEIYLAKGEYTLPSLYNYEGVTIIGVEGTVIGGEGVVTGFGGNFGKNTTIKNVTFTGSDDGVWYSYANGGTTVFENCTFAGDSYYGFHIDESNGATFIFNNCTFSGFNAFAGDLVKVTFNNCTFLHNGSYGHTNIWSVGEFNNCTWGEGATYGTRGDGIIYIDGAQYVTTSDALNAAIKAGETEIYLMAGEYELTEIRAGVTLKGADEKTVLVENKNTYPNNGAIYMRMNFENLTLTNTVYTMDESGNAEIGGGMSSFTNVTFAKGVREAYGSGVVFTDCTFGENDEGYALHFQYYAQGGLIQLSGCKFLGGNVHLGGTRTFEFTNCDFAAGTDFQVWTSITLSGCTVDGVAITADNIATFFPNLDVATYVTIK